MTKYLLGDIVERVKDHVDKDTTDLEYYVGGEHFDSNSLTVSKHGIIKESTIGPAFNTKFKSGDVLLMSRNPHLRKAGMVNFDGICSDVSYICRTKNSKILLQEYIPLIFQSNSFWSFAEANKKGSTNFFLNWSDFEKYELDLPDIEEQKKLSLAVWKAQSIKERYLITLDDIFRLENIKFLEMFGNVLLNDKKWDVMPISKLCPDKKIKPLINDEIWLLNLDMIESNTGRIVEKIYVNEKNMGTSIVGFEKGAILYSKLRPYLNKVVIADENGYGTSELVPLYNDENIIRKKFLFTLLRSDDFLNYTIKMSGGARMPRFPVSLLKDFNCIVPPIELQDEFCEFVDELNSFRVSVENSMGKINIIINDLIEKGCDLNV